MSRSFHGHNGGSDIEPSERSYKVTNIHHGVLEQVSEGKQEDLDVN